MTLLQLLAAENGGLAFEFLNRLSPKFFMRLGVNLATIFLLLRFVYLPSNRNREHIFTYPGYHFLCARRVNWITSDSLK